MWKTVIAVVLSVLVVGALSILDCRFNWIDKWRWDMYAYYSVSFDGSAAPASGTWLFGILFTLFFALPYALAGAAFAMVFWILLFRRPNSMDAK
jgi:hypothetical protein